MSRLRVGDEVLLTPEDEVGRVVEIRGRRLLVAVTSSYGALAGRTVVRTRAQVQR